MNAEPTKSSRKQQWQKMPDTNLVKYVPSGVFFARGRVNGKYFRKSLETKSITTARLRLNDFIKELRLKTSTPNGDGIFGDVVEEYLEQSKSDYRTKPRTKHYHVECVTALKKHAKSLFQLDVGKITDTDCTQLATKLSRAYSTTRFNGILSTLRAVFDIAVKSGYRYDNPAMAIKRAKPCKRELHLPSESDFRKLVEAAEKTSPAGGLMIQFLAYSGCRINEARHVLWSDVKEKEIIVRGDPETGTKNSEVRRVPIIAAMRELLAKHRPKTPAKDERVLKSDSCRRTLKSACEAVGTPVITHHDLRHLFATRCIESGVEIPTVSRWLGHKDGGALAMKTYGHLRNEHSMKMAEKVTF